MFQQDLPASWSIERNGDFFGPEWLVVIIRMLIQKASKKIPFRLGACPRK
jgi:hypothetical protein